MEILSQTAKSDFLVKEHSQPSGQNRTAILWGFAEATLFFIVPDVWLSYLARKDLRKGLIACVYALIGAISGGVLMYYWGWQNEVHAITTVAKVPAIDMEMINHASGQIDREGALSLLRGAYGGIPYKVYAVQAYGKEIGVLAFLFISLISRFSRFITVTCLFHFGLKLLDRTNVKWNPVIPLTIVWIVFYVFYFTFI